MARQLWHGYFNRQMCPSLRFSVSGSNETREYEGILDTGFTGFLSIPLKQAMLLGLEPHATTRLRYADGVSLTKPLARGIIRVGQEERTGLVILEPDADELLLGMSFLRLFNRALIVSRLAVALVDEEEFITLVSSPPTTS